MLTFVPGDRDRELTRGHAPAAALARELSAAWSIPVAPLLRRRPGVRRQRDLPRAERRRERCARVRSERRLPVPRLPRRRRLHDRLDRDRLRDGAPSSRRAAGSTSSALPARCGSRLDLRARDGGRRRHAMQLKLTARHDNPSDATQALCGGEAVEARSSSARPDARRGHVLARAQPVDRRRPHGRGGRPREGARPRRPRSRRRPTRPRSTSCSTSCSARSSATATSGRSRCAARAERRCRRRRPRSRSSCRGTSPRPRRGGGSAAYASGAAVEHQRAADQAEVAVRLRVVAEATLGERVVLLGEQPRRARRLEHLLEELLRVAAPAGAQVRLDQPRRADVEAALDARAARRPSGSGRRRRRCAAPPRPSARWRGSAGRRRRGARRGRSRATRRRCPRRRRRRSTRRPRRSSRARARSSRIRSRSSTHSGAVGPRRAAPAPRAPGRRSAST